ncbi:SDR family oxidoreductase [Streptomyces canus]|uniref:SDR family oxidoreductase n=1 Tax=Streptomyces canus TaxID=58343 RepID=UPI0033B245AC
MTTAVKLPSWAQQDTDLTGKTVLVIGGAGGVGEGITRTALQLGAEVIVTSRSEARLEDLVARAAHPNLRTRTLDMTGDDLAEAVSAIVEEHGRLDGIAIAAADWSRGGGTRILDLTEADWDAVIAQNQTSIFRAYRALIPALARGGVFVHINGFSAEIPYPPHGVGAVAAAATKSLTRTLAEEMRGDELRVYELILGVIRTRPRQLAGIDNEAWIPAAEVGTHIAELVAGNSPLADSALQYFVTRDAGPSRTAPQV